MTTSLNGWPVLGSSRTTGVLPRLRKWVVPLRGGMTPNPNPRHLLARDGAAGFLLVHMAAWWHDDVERLDLGVWDEWGYAPRPPRGQSSGFSNHASGTAVDLNATRHPFGVSTLATFTPRQASAIRHRLQLYAGCVDWGGNWRHPDGMHLEIAPHTSLAAVETRARALLSSPRGQEVLDANPGVRNVILS